MADARINEANFAWFVNAPSGPVMRAMQGIGEQVRAVGAANAPGTLGADLTVEVDGATVKVGHTAAKPHGVFVMGGTGIRAESSEWPPGTSLPMQLIRPRRARALRWEGPDGVHFAAYVRGIHAQPYLRRALEAVFARL